MDNVYHTMENMIDRVNNYYNSMVQRSEEKKNTQKNSVYLRPAPTFETVQNTKNPAEKRLRATS